MTQPESGTSFIEGNWDSISADSHRFYHEAMATTFEVIILHEDSRYAQQAARAAFDELDRLEAELSRFIENSDISRINNLAANRPLRIGLDAFECLQLSVKINAETNGAFDVTVGTRHAKQGTEYPIKLDEAQHTAERLTNQVQIDLGGIGKGFAVDRMAELLRQWSIDIALVSGGYSSVLALDAPPGTRGWPVTLSNPHNRRQTLARLYLQSRAVGASGLQKGSHIIDPRTGRPAEGKIAAWACAADAATVDALSTAFMVMSPDEIEKFCSSRPDMQAMVILQDEGKILHFGRWQENSA